MFGLSWGQITFIVLAGVFVLGPERIPTAVTWVIGTLRKARTMAYGAQVELQREFGSEIAELRRQVADLQSLKELQDLRELRELHPKRLINKSILGDEFSGGFKGFLGLETSEIATTRTMSAAGCFDDVVSDGLQVVDLHDAVDRDEQPLDEPEIPAGDAGDRGKVESR